MKKLIEWERKHHVGLLYFIILGASLRLFMLTTKLGDLLVTGFFATLFIAYVYTALKGRKA